MSPDFLELLQNIADRKCQRTKEKKAIEAHKTDTMKVLI
jgi:hypothetical protein